MIRPFAQYKPGVFKIANIDGWVVIAAGAQYIDEVRKAPDEVLSFVEATEQVRRVDIRLNTFPEADILSQRQQIKYTLGPGVGTGYHVSVTKTQLTRSLVVLFDDIRDETLAAFNDLIPAKEDGEWVKVRTQPMLQNVICRVSNRLFVGLPLCVSYAFSCVIRTKRLFAGRNKEWIKLNINFTLHAVIGGQILRLFPEFLKPCVIVRFITA